MAGNDGCYLWAGMLICLGEPLASLFLFPQLNMLNCPPTHQRTLANSSEMGNAGHKQMAVILASEIFLMFSLHNLLDPN